MDKRVKKLRALHGLAKAAGMDHEMLSESLCGHYGLDSLKDLSEVQLDEAALRLRASTPLSDRASGKPKRGYYGSGKANGLGYSRITAAQAGKISGLEYLLGWETNPARLAGFITRQTGKDKAVEWLSVSQAQKVIIGLQRILAGKDKALYHFLNTLEAGEMEANGELIRQMIADAKRPRD